MTGKLDHYRARVQAELEAAEAADCPQARAVHLQLAALYDEIVIAAGQLSASPPQKSVSQPIIWFANG